jgi:VanZ family protein
VTREGPPSVRRVLLSWLPVVLYTGLIWFLSSQNLDIRVDRFPLRDKGVHFFEYGALAFLISHAVSVSWPDARHRFLASLWLTMGLGLTDELHQAYVPGRMADTDDLIADTLGGLCAISFYFALRKWRARRVRKTAGTSESLAQERSGIAPEEAP